MLSRGPTLQNGPRFPPSSRDPRGLQRQPGPHGQPPLLGAALTSRSASSKNKQVELGLARPHAPVHVGATGGLSTPASQGPPTHSVTALGLWVIYLPLHLGVVEGLRVSLQVRALRLGWSDRGWKATACVVSIDSEGLLSLAWGRSPVTVPVPGAGVALQSRPCSRQGKHRPSRAHLCSVGGSIPSARSNRSFLHSGHVLSHRGVRSQGTGRLMDKLGPLLCRPGSSLGGRAALPLCSYGSARGQLPAPNKHQAPETQCTGLLTNRQPGLSLSAALDSGKQVLKGQKTLQQEEAC